MHSAFFLAALASVVAASPAPQITKAPVLAKRNCPAWTGGNTPPAYFTALPSSILAELPSWTGAPPSDYCSYTSWMMSYTSANTVGQSCKAAPTSAPVCAQLQPGGYGPQVSPDTPAAFEAYVPFHNNSLSAKTPKGYVETFHNLNASVTAIGYLGYNILTSYDTAACAAFCDSATGCGGFNLYIERDPVVKPEANCTNPPSITNYFCTLWSSGVNAAHATNFGQYRDSFQIVVVGSDGYSKKNATVTASTKPSTSTKSTTSTKPSTSTKPTTSTKPSTSTKPTTSTKPSTTTTTSPAKTSTSTSSSKTTTTTTTTSSSSVNLVTGKPATTAPSGGSSSIIASSSNSTVSAGPTALLRRGHFHGIRPDMLARRAHEFDLN